MTPHSRGEWGRCSRNPGSVPRTSTPSSAAAFTIWSTIFAPSLNESLGRLRWHLPTKGCSGKALSNPWVRILRSLSPVARGISTTASPSTWVWHASLYPSSSSFGFKSLVSEVVGEPVAFPSSMRTLHLPHVPRPPHSEGTSSPALHAASMMDVPGGTVALRPEGLKTTVTSMGARSIGYRRPST